MIGEMVTALTVGMANAVSTAVTRGAHRGRRCQPAQRYVSADIADRLVEALRHRRAEVTSLTAENDRLRRELAAAGRMLARRQTKSA